MLLQHQQYLEDPEFLQHLLFLECLVVLQHPLYLLHPEDLELQLLRLHLEALEVHLQHRILRGPTGPGIPWGPNAPTVCCTMDGTIGRTALNFLLFFAAIRSIMFFAMLCHL